MESQNQVFYCKKAAAERLGPDHIREEERLLAIRAAFIALFTVIALGLSACSGQAGSATTAPGAATTAAAGAATTAPSDSVTTAAEDTTTVSASSSDASDLLTIADVEKVSGLTGIKTVERASIPGAGGDVNFVTADGKLVLIATFVDGAGFDAWKDTPNYREPLSGLGDAAFVGPAKDITETLYEVGLKKGDHGALLVTFFKTLGKETVLTMDQVKELAGIVESRL
jgi:hypothetical protein